MVPTCSSGTLTNVLPHRNAMPQTQDMTPHPVTVYRHGADPSLWYPLMWNTQANAQLDDAVMVVVSRKLVLFIQTTELIYVAVVRTAV